MLKILLTLCILTGACGCYSIPAKEDTNSSQNTKDNVQTGGNVFENLEQNYIPLKEAAVESDFPEPNMNFDYPMHLSTKAELIAGITSEVTVDAPGYVNDEPKVYIDIDGHKAEVWFDTFEGADIVDLDITDNLRELALYTDGPSCDAAVVFMRYDGSSIHFIRQPEDNMDYAEIYGYFDADEKTAVPFYGALWVNQKGRMITSFQNIGFTDKRIALGGYEIGSDNIAKRVEFDKIDYFPKKYKISEDFQAFFTPVDTKPENMDDERFYFGYSMDNMTEFKKGQSIEIIDYEKSDVDGYYSFYVDIDGQKGVLKFWTGD